MNFPMTLVVAILAMHMPDLAHAHGMLLQPPSRQSAWRFNFGTPINYDDNGMNCGGFRYQWYEHGGQCGICGDPAGGPRRYERPDGSMVPNLVITAKYTQGDKINITVQITANHKGWHEFRICDTRKTNGIEATQACLNETLLEDENGQTRFPQPANPSFLHYSLQPQDQSLTCSHCVIQWKWHCGNNVGYGIKQEEFYGCSDVTINPRSGTFAPTQRPTPRPKTPAPPTPRPKTPAPPTPRPKTPAPPTPRPKTPAPPTPRPKTPAAPTGPRATTAKTDETTTTQAPWNADMSLPFVDRLRIYERLYFQNNGTSSKTVSGTHIKMATRG